MDQEQPLAALGERVRRQRERMGQTIDQAAVDGGISPVTWSRVELGRNVRRLSYGAVDRVLRWPPGACLDFLQSGIEPAPADEAPPDDLDEPLTEQEIDQIAAEADEILSRLEGRIASDRNRAQMEAARRLVRWVVEEETNRSGSP